MHLSAYGAMFIPNDSLGLNSKRIADYLLDESVFQGRCSVGCATAPPPLQLHFHPRPRLLVTMSSPAASVGAFSPKTPYMPAPAPDASMHVLPSVVMRSYPLDLYAITADS